MWTREDTFELVVCPSAPLWTAPYGTDQLPKLKAQLRGSIWPRRFGQIDIHADRADAGAVARCQIGALDGRLAAGVRITGQNATSAVYL
jgi:hypothetical protein